MRTSPAGTVLNNLRTALFSSKIIFFILPDVSNVNHPRSTFAHRFHVAHARRIINPDFDT